MTVDSRMRSTFEAGIVTLTIDHPPVNVLTREVLGTLRDQLDRFRTEPSVRALVLTAAGKHFSAGADVGEHLAPQYEEMIPEFLATVEAIAAFPAPLIAAVRGRCLGGGFELVQAADVVIAGSGAVFGQPEIVLGVFPPAACALLADRCTPMLARALILTGDPIDAGRAVDLGLVHTVVPDDAVEATAQRFASRLARHSAAALRAAKRALEVGRGDERSARLRAVGSVYTDELMATHDAAEGLQAFLDKREPVWEHR